MNEPKTIRVKNGGSGSLERGPDEKDWTRLKVATADRTVALNVITNSRRGGRVVFRAGAARRGADRPPLLAALSTC